VAPRVSAAKSQRSRHLHSPRAPVSRTHGQTRIGRLRALSPKPPPAPTPACAALTICRGNTGKPQTPTTLTEHRLSAGRERAGLDRVRLDRRLLHARGQVLVRRVANVAVIPVVRACAQPTSNTSHVSTARAIHLGPHRSRPTAICLPRPVGFRNGSSVRKDARCKVFPRAR
jgi:hypothetical protein